MVEYKGPVWKGKPDKTTPLSADRLNALSRAVEDHGARIAEVEGAPGGSEQGNMTATGRSVALGADQPVGIILGSSSVFGSGVPEQDRPTLRFAHRLERKLQKNWGVDADHQPFTMIAGDPNSPFVNGGAALQGGLGKFSRLVKDGEQITFTSPAQSTGIWVGFREGSSVGAITLSVDGGDPVDVPVTQSGGSRWTGQWRSAEVARGEHQYTFTVAGGSQVFDFVHFFDESNDSGPILLNGGWGEATLGSLLDQASTAQRLKSVDPDFVIMVMGSNDQGANTSREDFAAAVQKAEDMISENTTGTVWVAWFSQARPGTPGFDRSIVIDPMREAAAAKPSLRSFSPVLENFWTDNNTDRNILGTLFTDNVHPTATGHRAIADLIGEAMGLAGGRGV